MIFIGIKYEIEWVNQTINFHVLSSYQWIIISSCGYKMSCSNWTTIWVCEGTVKQLVHVKIIIQLPHSIIEGDVNDLPIEITNIINSKYNVINFVLEVTLLYQDWSIYLLAVDRLKEYQAQTFRMHSLEVRKQMGHMAEDQFLH